MSFYLWGRLSTCAPIANRRKLAGGYQPAPQASYPIIRLRDGESAIAVRGAPARKQARAGAARGAVHGRGNPETPSCGDAGWPLVEEAQRSVLVRTIRPLRLVGFVAAQEIEGGVPGGDGLLDGVADQDLPETVPDPAGVHPTLIELKRLAHGEPVERRHGGAAGFEQEQSGEPLRRQNPHGLGVKLCDSRRQECALRLALFEPHAMQCNQGREVPFQFGGAGNGQAFRLMFALESAAPAPVIGPQARADTGQVVLEGGRQRNVAAHNRAVRAAVSGESAVSRSSM